MVAEVGVENECEIEGCGVFGQGFQFAFRGKYEYFRGKKIEFDRIEKIESVGFGIFEYFFDCFQPNIQFRFFVGTTYFVFPMSRKSPFGDFVHFSAAYLYLRPVSVGAHDGYVQSPVTIGFGVAHPVAGAFGVNFINIGDHRVNVKAFGFFVFLLLGVEYDTHRI